MLYQYALAIAGIIIRIETEQPLMVEPAFHPFLTQDGVPDFWALYRQVDALAEIPAEVIYEDNCYRVHPDGKGGAVRYFFDAPRDNIPYGMAQCDANVIRVGYLEKGKRNVSQMQNCFFHLGFEELLIRKNRLCFHAACVDTSLGGILFAGPSGIGKSTQAELWCRYRSAKQINGDRPILSKGDHGWLAWGSPYAGSSRCHINENCSVAAVVMLKQDNICSLRRLSSGEAFRAMWPGMIMHSWDKSFVQKACDLTLELIRDVPVFAFACTPDEAAVDYLERELKKEGCL